MLKAVGKFGGKLSKSFGQVLGLPTISTVSIASGFLSQVSLSQKHTINTQFSDWFTQAFLANFNLFNQSLCPVSTGPINNTNLIKDLYL